MAVRQLTSFQAIAECCMVSVEDFTQVQGLVTLDLTSKYSR